MIDQMISSKSQLEHQISSLILATDITRQQEYLSQFKVIIYGGIWNYMSISDSLKFPLISCYEFILLRMHVITTEVKKNYLKKRYFFKYIFLLLICKYNSALNFIHFTQYICSEILHICRHLADSIYVYIVSFL